MNGWGVHRIHDVVGSKNVQQPLHDGRWVRAVPEPYTAGRVLAAWRVLTGKAVALEWPTSADLADALDR